MAGFPSRRTGRSRSSARHRHHAGHRARGQTVVYDAPFAGGASFEAMFNAMIENKVTVISNSWAYCEDQTTLADVQGIDTVFQNAAAAGISIFNGTGDNGSTCLDGVPTRLRFRRTRLMPPRSEAVPKTRDRRSPTLARAGGMIPSTTPPAGHGRLRRQQVLYGAELIRTGCRHALGARCGRRMRIPFTAFRFARPAPAAVPPASLYGGTSFAAPQWAAFTALLNQAQGTNLGFLNPLIYPLAEPMPFTMRRRWTATLLMSDLGSPNLDAMNLADWPVGGQPWTQPCPRWLLSLNDFRRRHCPAVFSMTARRPELVTVFLRDANGHYISGKTVKLQSSGGNAEITPASGVTTRR